jgi:hypothetical protein
VIGEHRHTIKSAIALGIFQELDRAEGILGRTLLRLFAGGNAADCPVELAGLVQLDDVVVAVTVVTVEFTDEKPTASVKTHPGRFGQHRLGADQLDAEAFRQAKPFATFLR